MGVPMCINLMNYGYDDEVRVATACCFARTSGPRVRVPLLLYFLAGPVAPTQGEGMEHLMYGDSLGGVLLLKCMPKALPARDLQEEKDFIYIHKVAKATRPTPFFPLPCLSRWSYGEGAVAWCVSIAADTHRLGDESPL